METRMTGILLDSPPVVGRCLDVVEPGEGEAGPAFFLIHGGGWDGGHRGQYYPVLDYLRRRGHPVAAAEYRLCDGRITVADQLTDLRHGYDWLIRFLRCRSGRKCPQVVVMGSSAGAHLAALLAYAAPGECGESLVFGDRRLEIENWVPPAGLVAVCGPATMTPWPDIHPGIWESMQKAVGCRYGEDTRERFERFSPARYRGKNSCPTLLVGAELENLFPLRFLERWRDELRACGGYCECRVYAGQVHGFLYQYDNESQRRALRDIVDFAEALRQQQEA